MANYGRDDTSPFPWAQATGGTWGESLADAYARGRKDGYDHAIRMLKEATKALKAGRKEAA